MTYAVQHPWEGCTIPRLILNMNQKIDHSGCHSTEHYRCDASEFAPVHVGFTVALPTLERLEGWWMWAEEDSRMWSLSYAYECATAILKHPTWDCTEHGIATINWANDLCIAWYAWADWILHTRDHLSPLLAGAAEILVYLHNQGFKISPVYREPTDLEEDLHEIYCIIRDQLPKTAWK